MQGKILKKFKFNTKKYKKENLYHTVYIIELENDCFYIGKRSCLDVDKDKYICSSTLVNNMIKNGMKFKRTILYYFGSSKEAIEAETKILQSEIYHSKKCLNCYPGSPPDLTGTIIINKDKKFKMINPKLKDFYLNNGWELGGLKKIYIYKNKEIKLIFPEEIELFLNLGWNLGNPNSRERTFISKNDVLKFVKNDFLKEYLSEGWEITHNVKDRIVIEKNNIIKKVYSNELDNYLNDGWIKSSCVKNKIWIYKENTNKRINKEMLDNYLNDGWAIGSNAKNKIYINNGLKEKRISETQLKEYLSEGWNVGRLEKIRLYKNDKEKRVNKVNKEIIEKLKSDGWVRNPSIKH